MTVETERPGDVWRDEINRPEARNAFYRATIRVLRATVFLGG